MSATAYLVGFIDTTKSPPAFVGCGVYGMAGGSLTTELRKRFPVDISYVSCDTYAQAEEVMKHTLQTAPAYEWLRRLNETRPEYEHEFATASALEAAAKDLFDRWHEARMVAWPGRKWSWDELDHAVRSGWILLAREAHNAEMKAREDLNVAIKCTDDYYKKIQELKSDIESITVYVDTAYPQLADDIRDGKWRPA